MELQKQIIIEACDLIAHYPEDDNVFREQLWIIYKTTKEMWSDSIPLELPVSFAKCSVCGELKPTSKMNGIYRYGLKYYCKHKDCQERFYEDAGNPPDYE